MILCALCASATTMQAARTHLDDKVKKKHSTKKHAMRHKRTHPKYKKGAAQEKIKTIKEKIEHMKQKIEQLPKKEHKTDTSKTPKI